MSPRTKKLSRKQRAARAFNRSSVLQLAKSVREEARRVSAMTQAVHEAIAAKGGRIVYTKRIDPGKRVHTCSLCGGEGHTITTCGQTAEERRAKRANR